jgi:hypothetical protein
MTDWHKQRHERQARLDEAARFASGKMVSPENAKALLEAVIHVGDQGPVIELPVQGPCEDRVYSSWVGPVRRLRFPVEIEGNPLFWEHPAECAGASNPEWVTLSARSS